MSKNITHTPDYSKPQERESMLDQVLLDAHGELRPEISFYSGRAIFLTQECMREKMIGLIKDCPRGDQLLEHLKIAVIKKCRKKTELTKAA